MVPALLASSPVAHGRDGCGQAGNHLSVSKLSIQESVTMIDKDLLGDCLTGLDFPADVHTIVERSEANDCPQGIVSQLQSSPSRTYGSRDELLCRLGDTDACHLHAVA